jgi:hypothetical protein
MEHENGTEAVKRKNKNNLCGAVSLDRIFLPGRLPFSRFGASPE